jgi:hypothetical protein
VVYTVTNMLTDGGLDDWAHLMVHILSLGLPMLRDDRVHQAELLCKQSLIRTTQRLQQTSHCFRDLYHKPQSQISQAVKRTANKP